MIDFPFELKARHLITPQCVFLRAAVTSIVSERWENRRQGTYFVIRHCVLATALPSLVFLQVPSLLRSHTHELLGDPWHDILACFDVPVEPGSKKGVKRQKHGKNSNY